MHCTSLVSHTISLCRVKSQRVLYSSSIPVVVTRHDELNAAFEIAHNIVRNMTDMKLTKMLHMYCGGVFLEHFGQVLLLQQKDLLS